MRSDTEAELNPDEAVGVLERLFPGKEWLADVESELRADGWTGPRGGASLTEWLGDALWDVFSNNHDVIAPDGRIVHLGSFRGSGDTIATFLEARLDGARFDYMDFYMGTFNADDAGAVAPLHRLIFRRLRALGFTWRYAFPRIYAFRFARPEPVDDPSHPDWKPYSPEEALAREAEEQKSQAEHDELQETLERGYREDLEKAKHEAPPPIVRAFRDVYDRDPQGWPPWEE